MGTFLVFILKSTLCLTAFYLFYRLLLSRDTFHRFNRMALLGVAALSIVLPFIRLEVSTPAVNQHPVQNLEYLLQMAQAQAQTELEPSNLSLFVTSLFVLYMCGCLFFLIRWLYSAWLIFRLIKSGQRIEQEGGIHLIIASQPVSPFSWMKYIVISRIDFEESGREIRTHEEAHINAGHSFDMLLMGICTILHWFNPAVWLLKQELQNVHEYEADESVIAHGVDAKGYQLLLIKKAVGTERFTSMVNSFNHNKLKKRIAMMLKQKSSPYARLKYLYVLPLTALTVAVFARPEISRPLETISAVKVIETPVAPPDTVVVVGYGTMENASATDKEKVINVDELKEKPLLIVDDQEKEAGYMDKLKPEDIESISVLKDKESIEQYGNKGKYGVIFVTTRKGQPADMYGVKFKSLPNLKLQHENGMPRFLGNPRVIVDGKEVPYEEMDNIDPNNIQTISVLKSESAVARYGKEGNERGVIEIETKKK